MGKYCPIVNKELCYLECRECEEGICNQKSQCSGCINFLGLEYMSFAGKNFWRTKCGIFRNNIFDYTKVNNCEYHNKDLKKEKICLNCKHYLGMGDFGLSCKKNYYAIPHPTTKACDKFENKYE